MKKLLNDRSDEVMRRVKSEESPAQLAAKFDRLDIEFLKHLNSGPKSLSDMEKLIPGFGRYYNSEFVRVMGLITREYCSFELSYTITFKGRMVIANFTELKTI
jgi:hypothetical protein